MTTPNSPTPQEMSEWAELSLGAASELWNSPTGDRPAFVHPIEVPGVVIDGPPFQLSREQQEELNRALEEIAASRRRAAREAAHYIIGGSPHSPTVAAPISAATPPGAPLPVEEVVAPVRGNASARPPLGCLCGGTYRTEYRPQWDGDVDTVLVCRSCGQES